MLLSGVLFVLFLAGCWLYCLTDAVLTPKWEYRSRLAKSTWIYLIAATFIVGAVAWLIARRTWRNKPWVTAAVRHPAGRSRQAPTGHGTLPKGPDDDPEFMRQLDSRIRGTSTDPGELRAGLTPLSRELFWPSAIFASLFALFPPPETFQRDQK